VPKISGTVVVNGQPSIGNTIRLYRRDTGVMIGQTKSGDGTPDTDPDLDSVSLLLHFDQPEGSGYTVDSSPRTKPVSITSGQALLLRAANKGVCGLHPPAGWVTAPAHADFGLPDTFTIECMVYTFGGAEYQGLLNIGTSTNGLMIRVRPTEVELYANNVRMAYTAALPPNTWIHLALVRLSNVVTLYLNGSPVGTTTYVPAIPALGLVIGVSAGATTEVFNGYIDEVRITKGIARYTIPFIPRTTQFTGYSTVDNDPYLGYVVLLLSADQPYSTTAITDSSLKRKQIIVGGTTSRSTVQRRFSGSSIEFNNGSYYQGNNLSISSGLSDFSFPADFTVECWVHPLSYGASWGSFIVDTRNTGWYLTYGYSGSGNKVTFGDGSANSLYSDSVMTLGVWTHLAVVRIGSTIKMYVNGVPQAATMSNSATIPCAVFVMGSSYNGENTTGINGYLSDVRITNGVGRYTTNFVLNMALPTTFTIGQDPYYQNVTLLLHGDGPNNSTVFTDETGKGPTGVGSAKISTTQSKFGGSSIYLPQGGPLVYASSTDFDLNNGDWTIELWYYEQLGSLGTLISRRASGTAEGWVLTTRGVRGLINGSGFEDQHNWGTPAYEQWHHLAWVRNGSTLQVYLNGVLVSQKTGVGTLADNGGDLNIGQADQISENRFLGYIDDLRITKGVARYKANFAPTAAFPGPVVVEVVDPSSTAGYYELTTDYQGEVQVLCLDVGAPYNDQVVRGRI